MKAIFVEDKQYNPVYGDPDECCFGIEPNPPHVNQAIKWDKCREQFASKFNETITGFYFSHKEKALEAAEFLTKFEVIVGLDYLSCFSKTCRKSIIWVIPSKFWLECPIKRSLITLILRCGINYNLETDNFDECLFGEFKESILARETKSAILRFMFGFTHWTSTMPPTTGYSSILKHGWREEFFAADDNLIRKKLILPENKNKELSIVGIESLWT